MIVKELVYMVLDELKISSDDAYFTEDHVIFLASKYKNFLLKQRYSDIKKYIPESNLQYMCIELEEVPPISGECCEGGSYLRSTEKLPFLMLIGRKISIMDLFLGTNLILVSPARFKFVGNSPYLKSFLYATIGMDNYLYLKSVNPLFLYLEKVIVSGIPEDFEEAWNNRCDKDEEGNENCDIIDAEFPIESALVPPLIELIVKELSGPLYRPKDDDNNAADDLSKVLVG